MFRIETAAMIILAAVFGLTPKALYKSLWLDTIFSYQGTLFTVSIFSIFICNCSVFCPNSCVNLSVHCALVLSCPPLPFTHIMMSELQLLTKMFCIQLLQSCVGNNFFLILVEQDCSTLVFSVSCLPAFETCFYLHPAQVSENVC